MTIRQNSEVYRMKKAIRLYFFNKDIYFAQEKPGDGVSVNSIHKPKFSLPKAIRN